MQKLECHEQQLGRSSLLESLFESLLRASKRSFAEDVKQAPGSELHGLL